MTAATVPTPAEMPGATCGKGTGLYRCCRKALHGGNCTPVRRDDIDLAEHDGELAPDGELTAITASLDGHLRELARATATPLELVQRRDRAPRSATTPFGLADQLESAARALRLSGSKHLSTQESTDARAIGAGIVARVAAHLAPDPSGPSSPGPEPT